MNNRQSLIKNTLLLFTAMFLSKVIGAVLKIPLTNILGGVGMGFFSMAYSIFTPVFALTASGIPTVISKMTAQNIACGFYKNAEIIKNKALRLAIILGLSGMVSILVLAVPFSKYISGSPDSLLSVLAIAPSILFCCIAAVYKGYYEGKCDMFPTAVSQVVEAIVKASAGLLLSAAALHYYGENAYAQASAAAVVGVSLSEAAGLAYLIIYCRYKEHKGKPALINPKYSKSAVPTAESITLMYILKETLPISAGAAIINLGSFVDMFTIPNCINLSAVNNKSYFLKYFIYGKTSGLQISDVGNFIYGSYTGIVNTLFMLIPAMTGLILKSFLPNIAAAFECKNRRELERNVKLLFSSTFAVGLPLCFIMGVLTRPLLILLYPERRAEVAVSELSLQLMCAGGIVIPAASAMFCVFQAIDRSDLPIKLMIPSIALKLVLNIVLTSIPSLNISGAVISTIVSYFAVCAAGSAAIRKCIGIKGVVTKTLIKPLCASLIAAAAAFISYANLFSGFSSLFRIAFSTIAAGTVYFILYVLLNLKALVEPVKQYRV